MMQNKLDNLYDFLFVLLVLALPYSLKIPNIILLLLVSMVLIGSKQTIRERSRLLVVPVVSFFAFSAYLWIKAILTGTIHESKYDLLLLILVVQVLFIRVKDPSKVLFGTLASGTVLMIPAIFRLADYYFKNNEVLPFEGTRINDILGMERPYLGFFLVITILVAMHLSKLKPNFRALYWGYAAVATCFVFYISARIAAGTLGALAGIYLVFYFRTSVKKKAIATGVAIGALLVMLALNQNLRDRLFISADTSKSVAKFERHEPRFIIWPCAMSVSRTSEHNTFLGLISEQRLDTLMTRCYDKTIANRHRAAFFVKSTLNTHNQYLNIYLTSGVLGIILIAAFFGSIVVYFRRQFLSVALAVATALFFAVENVLHRQMGAYYFALVLALAVLYQKKQEYQEK